MNVLKRRMFRPPNMSRQPMGILASSPELMSSAQRAVAQGQPVKKNVGGPVVFGRGPNLGGREPIYQQRPPVKPFSPANMPIIGPLTQNFGDTGAYIDSLQKTTPRSSNLERLADVAGKTGLRIVRAPGDLVAGIAGIGAGVEDFLTRPDPYGQGITATAQANAERMDDYEKEIARRLAEAAEMRGQMPLSPEDLEEEKMAGERLASVTSSMDTGDPVVDDAVGEKAEEKQDKPKDEQKVIKPEVDTPADDAPAPTQTQTPEEKQAFSSQARSKLEGLLTGQQGQSAEALTADEAATPEAAAALSMVTPEKASLSEMEDRAKQIMGFDPKRAEEGKRNAFWQNLTMAGLAIAAGESDNALTNVAKGLMVGMDAYAKDIKDLNAQEREDRKEYRATLRDLIKTEEDRNIAVATMTNNFNVAKADLENRKSQFATEQEFRERKLELDTEHANKIADINIMTAIADLDFKDAQLGIQQDQLSLEKRKQSEQERKNRAQESIDRLKNTPEWQSLGESLGYLQRDKKTGEFDWTEKGKKWKEEKGEEAFDSLFTQSAKDNRRQGSTLPRQVEELVNNDKVLELVEDDLRNQGVENPTSQQILQAIIGLAQQIPGNQSSTTASGFSLPK